MYFNNKATFMQQIQHSACENWQQTAVTRPNPYHSQYLFSVRYSALFCIKTVNSLIIMIILRRLHCRNKFKITYIVNFVTQNRVDYSMKEYESDSVQVSLYDLLMNTNNEL